MRLLLVVVHLGRDDVVGPSYTHAHNFLGVPTGRMQFVV